MKSAELLAGKDAVEKTFPYYDEKKQKALELIEIYKNNVAGGKKADKDSPLWQPAI